MANKVRIPVIGPNGEKGTMPASSMAEAVKRGWKVATPESGESGLAAAAGGLRGFTVGLSDPALVGASDAISELTGAPNRTQEMLEGLKTENPGVTIAGEAAGTVASAFIPGGPVAQLARAGKAVKLAAGGKLLGSMAGAAAETGLFGLGNIVSEKSLGETSTNAQKLASLAGAGLFGAGFGAVTHGVGAAGSALMEKFGGKSLNEALNNLADAGLSAQLSSKNVINKRKITPDQLKETFRYARENGLTSVGDTNESFLDKVTAHKQGIGDEIGGVMQDLDSKVSGFDTSRLEAKLQPMLKDLRKDPGSHRSADEIQRYLDEMQNTQFSKAWDIQSNLRKKFSIGDSIGYKDDMMKFRNELRDEIKAQAGEVSPFHEKTLNEASQRYFKASNLEKMAEEQLKRQNSNAVFGLGDRVMGSAGAVAGAMRGGPMGILQGVAGAVGSKVLRERGGFMMSAAAEKLASSQTLERMATSLKSTIDALGEQGALGPYALALENAGAKGAMHLLAAHVQLAQSDPKYLPTLGLENEDENASNQYAAKADKLGSLKGVLDSHDANVEQQIGRFLGQVGGRYPAYKAPRADLKDFNLRMQRINQVMRDPASVDTASLASTAPQLAAAAAVHAQQAAQFLLDKAPKNPGVNGMKALSMPWEPSRAQLEKFYRYVNAVETPTAVLQQLRTGTITPEAAEVMRTVYPQLLEDMKGKMMNRLNVYSKPLSYHQKRAIDSLFGSEYRGGNPHQLLLLQQMHAGNLAQKPPQKPDGRQTQTQEDNLSTQAQKTEAR